MLGSNWLAGILVGSAVLATLRQLYRIHPRAEKQIKKAAGYGIFSNIGLKLFVISAGNGWGIVRDNGTGEDTHMKMVTAGLGIVLGVKDF